MMPNHNHGDSNHFAQQLASPGPIHRHVGWGNTVMLQVAKQVTPVQLDDVGHLAQKRGRVTLIMVLKLRKGVDRMKGYFAMTSGVTFASVGCFPSGKGII